MLPHSSNLIDRINITIPLIGVYDAPDTSPFEPLVTPEQSKFACVFAFYKNWLS